TAGALRRFLDTHSVVPDLPVAVSCRGFTRLYLSGPEEPARALVRALLAQLAVFHPPDDLLIAALVAPERRPDWEYLKWLPPALPLARQLAPLRLAASQRSGETPLHSDTGLTELLGIVDADGYEARDGWAPRPQRARLRVPIGTGAEGQPVELDLKESAQDGM